MYIHVHDVHVCTTGQYYNMFVCEDTMLFYCSPPHLGRRQDLKVEQKHYKASVCVVRYFSLHMNITHFSCVPVDRGLPYRNEKVSGFYIVHVHVQCIYNMYKLT